MRILLFVHLFTFPSQELFCFFSFLRYLPLLPHQKKNFCLFHPPAHPHLHPYALPFPVISLFYYVHLFTDTLFLHSFTSFLACLRYHLASFPLSLLLHKMFPISSFLSRLKCFSIFRGSLVSLGLLVVLPCIFLLPKLRAMDSVGPYFRQILYSSVCLFIIVRQRKTPLLFSKSLGLSFLTSNPI